NYGIKQPHIVLGPKIPQSNEYYSILAAELQKCLSNEQTPEEACKSIRTQLDELNGAG
ncbi:MAG: multiple sugar transport system substrate-binding protein, partial [Alphaproteobacteria bacterium]|nr:multiple sugar transport system substrate-binding protein [Alphaproteobacteria bacterium]